jgi:ribosome-associated translation inhibitor RaiA
MRPTKTDQPNVHVELTDGIPVATRDYVRDKITDLTKFSRRPILFVKVRLITAGHGNNLQVVARANLDVNGTPLITHTVAKTATEAVDLLKDKIHGRLTRM